MPGLRDRKKLDLSERKGANGWPNFAMRDTSGENEIKHDISKENKREKRTKQYQNDKKKQREAEQQSQPNNTANILRQSESTPQEDIQSDQLGSVSDLAKQEGSRLNYKTPGGQGTKFGKKGLKGILSSTVKKRLAIFGITILTGVSVLGGLGAISAPMQFLAFANFLDDSVETVTKTYKGLRMARNISNIIKHGMNSGDNWIAQSRLGIVGNLIADKYNKRYMSKGINFKTNVFGDSMGMEIDLKTYYNLPDNSSMFDGDKAGNKAAQDFAKDIGLDTKDVRFTKGADGRPKLLVGSENPSRKSMKKMARWAHKITGGRYKVASALSSRLLRKRVGLTGFHPWRKLRQKAIAGFNKRLEERQKEKAEEIQVSIEERKRKEWEEKGMDTSGPDFAEAVKKAKDKATKRFDKLLMKTNRRLMRFAAEGALDLTGVGAAAGIPMMVMDWLCMLNDIQKGLGPTKQERVIAPAEDLSVTYRAIASGAKNSNDPKSEDDSVDILEAGDFARQYLFAEVETTDIQDVDTETGEMTEAETGGTVYSSWYNSPPLQASLGQEYNSNDVPMALKLEDGIVANIDTLIDETSNEILGNIKNNAKTFADKEGTWIDIECWAYDTIMDIAFWPANLIAEGTVNLAKKIDAVNWLMTKMSDFVTGWLYGQPLDIDNSLPQDMASIAIYGAKYKDNDMGMTVGALPMTETESAQLWQEHQEELALEWREKPIMERLFDKTDYRSAISQLAIRSQWNMGDESLETRLANVGKTVAATPKLMASALRNLGSVNAASGPYDYGVATWGFSDPEEGQMLENDTYSFTKNTEYMYDKYFDGNDTKEIPNGGTFDFITDFEPSLSSCFGVTVEPDGRVITVDNTNGSAYNFLDFDQGKRADCQEGIEDSMRWRLYLMDYEIMMSDAILDYGDGEDDENGKAYDTVKQACEDMEVCGSSSNNSNIAGDGDISGDDQSLARAIIDSGKISNGIGWSGASNPVEQIKAIANGSPIQGSVGPCYVHTGVLQVVKLATEMFDSVGLSTLNRSCNGNSTSTYWHERDGGGRAIDFASFNGTATNGADANAIKLLNAVHKRIQDGQAFGFGQRQCGSGRTGQYNKAFEFEDSCNHLHIDSEGDHVLK